MNDSQAKFAQLVAPPVFIVGAARSGTTWVHDIFQAHPDVATAYETFLFTQNGLGSFFSQTHSSPHHGIGRLFEEGELTDYIRQIAIDILSKVIEPQHQYLVEKSPNHIESVGIIRQIFPTAKFIHLVRDGRDVYISVRAATRSWMPNWKNTFARSVRVHAGSWRSEIEKAQQAQQQLGGDFMQITYEELHHDPKAGYQKLFDFAGVPYDGQILDDIFQKTDFQTNYQRDESNFRRGGRVQDWKHHMTLLEALQFNYKAGQTLIDLGYEQNRYWLPRIF